MKECVPCSHCRADKIKKATKNALRNSGALSETESDHSRTTDRDSTELKMASLVALPLAKPPEKGILKKKHGRSMDNFKVATPEEMVPLQKRSAVTIPRMSAHYTDDFKLSSQGHGKLGGEDSDSSEDSDNSIVGDADGYAVLRSPDHHKTGTQMDGVVSPECPVRPSLEVSRDGGVTGAKNRILKLKNLNELLRQIDEQFNNVLKQTDPVASPGGSSDTEADRQGAVYQASEDGLGVGFSPPHRSPVLSPSSPDPLLSPGDIGDFPAMSPMSECYEKPSRFRVRKSAPTSQPGGTPTAVSPSACSSHSGSSHAYTALQMAPPEENVWQPRVPHSGSGSSIATTTMPSPNSDNRAKAYSGATSQRQQPLPFTAVPYRCGKTTGGGKPGGSSPGQYRQKRGTPPPPPVRGCSVPAPKQPTVVVTSDGQSISEGYHSDRDETIILREIPKPSTLQLSSRQRATPSRCLSSPEDIDV